MTLKELHEQLQRWNSDGVDMNVEIYIHPEWKMESIEYVKDSIVKGSAEYAVIMSS